MTRAGIITLNVRAAVNKTFHISEDEIILHVDTNNVPIKVPEKYRKTLIEMAEIARDKADFVVTMIDYNIDGEIKGIGDRAQKIWEEVITG